MEPSPDNVEQNTGTSQASQWETPPVEDTLPDPTEQLSPGHDNESDQGAPKPSVAPMQKRRRVTRACDECRRKKIKCDGKQPCTHCTVYSYECTYDQPSNRRRNAAPQYIEALETQLKRAKALLHIVFPNLDLNDPSLDAHLQNGALPQLLTGPPRARQNPADQRVPPRRDQRPREENHDPSLESMVKATGQLELDEEGHWDYHGHSSGVSFMRRMKEQFGDIMAPPPGAFVKYRPMSQILDSPKSAMDSPSDSNLALLGVELPSKADAKQLCEHALIDAATLVRTVHIPSFYQDVDRIYDTPLENYGDAENTFLPFLYAVLALGTLFSQKNTGKNEKGYESAIEEGFKYFKAARQMLDIADCRDLHSLQAVLFLTQFLQSSAKLSTCYAYIGVAQRSALRMGLHRSFNMNFNPIEAETRKRVFWAIRKMDIYVGAMLGLPHFLGEDDIDQEYPAEVDDECITETEIRPMPEGKICLMAGVNAHTRMVHILAKICRYIYPIKGTQSQGAGSLTYSINYSRIRQLEQDLQNWLDDLPMALKPGGETSPLMIRVQQLLRMAFGHAQLLLYRPFLHYVSQSPKTKTADQRAFACASACVSVSRNIIHITCEMKKRGLLDGAYWFSMYTTFFAIISIIYFVLENPDNSTSVELFRDASQGKEALAQFAKRSMAADRCSATLNNLFDKLPSHIKQGGDFATKKRRQDGSPKSHASRPDLANDPDFVELGIRRASTFPESMPNAKRTSFPHPVPLSHSQFAGLARDSSYSSGSQRSSEYFETAPSLTPTPTTPSTMNFSIPSNQGPLQGPSQSFPPTPLTTTFVDSTGLNIPVSDVSAMMFPSADPFAYPNQPMTTFENNNPRQFKNEPMTPNFSFAQGPSAIDHKSRPSFFDTRNTQSPNISSNGIPTMQHGDPRGDSDVQLYTTMPMYLMHGGQMGSAQNQPPFQVPQNPSAHYGGAEGGHVNFDELFTGEEWANTFMDHGIGFGASGFGRGGAPGGPMMGNWR